MELMFTFIHRKVLGNQFTNEMSWDNMGDYWHIDHIIPFAAFDLSIHTNQHIVCWYKVQPLHGPENNEKSDKYEEEDKQDLIRVACSYNLKEW